MSATTLKITIATATRFLSTDPASAPNNAVTVVPRSAPIAIAAADVSGIAPAYSALSVIIIVAELD